MNLDGDASTDEYFVTASQIFDYCGADSTGTMRVDVLMDKFAPFVNKAEFGTKIAELKSLLDPNQCNPEITVNKLAMTLNTYSESQKIKVDLEESFNIKGEQGPHDSDSGISTDGFHLLEELQSELREKAHLAAQLRSRLEYSDRHHEEALAALAAERDDLRAHLHVLREENQSLSGVRRDYEEACERLCSTERALDAARRDLDVAGKRARGLQGQLADADLEKSRLQEQLARSTAECHRINEMYAARQAALRQENEALRAERAELAARLHDQAEFVQQLLKEKVHLEMELKDMLNRSNLPSLRAERSIDVSYTEDQMLSELDSLNADSRFVQEQSTVSTQAELPCVDCVTRKATPSRSLKNYLWEPLKWVFQLLAVLCFACALSALYAVTARARACRDPAAAAVPWRWLHAQDLMDLLLRIEYVADVPM